MTSPGHELDRNKDEYLHPAPDRIVDQKIFDWISDFLIPKIPPGSILELGVGDQVWTPKLLQQFASVTSVDGSAELLANMENLLAEDPDSRARWTGRVCLFEDFVPAERFDSVLATYVLEHVPDPGALLSRIRGWLKPGGTLLVAVPHALSLHRRLAVHMGMLPYSGALGDTDRRMQHFHCFTCYQMEQMIMEAGFRIADKGGMFAKPLPNAVLATLTDQQLRGLFDLGRELPIEYSAAIYFVASAG